MKWRWPGEKDTRESECVESEPNGTTETGRESSGGDRRRDESETKIRSAKYNEQQCHIVGVFTCARPVNEMR